MNSSEIAKIYDEQCVKSKSSWEASFWSGAEDQYGRFVVVGSHLGNFGSIIDVGCGQGDFFYFLLRRNPNLFYLGLDLSAEAISRAKKHTQAYFLHDDFLTSESLTTVDYVVGMGAFSMIADGDQYEYLGNALSKCFSLCKKGVVFTITAESADVKFPQIFYYSPIRVLEIICKITPYFVLNTSSLGSEILGVLIKNESEDNSQV